MINNQKNSILIIIVLIVMVLLSGGILVWQYFKTLEKNGEALEEIKIARENKMEEIKITEENKVEKLNEIYPKFLAMEACQGISQGRTSEKIVALTFDDGPNKEYTREILSILENYNIKAGFFIKGKYAKIDPELVKEIFEKGHIIGNHSFSHPNFIHISEQEIKEEIKKTSEIIYKITGEHPIFFRPPFGACSPLMIEILREKNYQIITWSAMTNDWDPVTAEHIAQDILRRVGPGGIIGLHDGCPSMMGGDRSQTVKALPKIIKELRNRGYRFASLDDLLNISAYSPTNDSRSQSHE